VLRPRPASCSWLSKPASDRSAAPVACRRRPCAVDAATPSGTALAWAIREERSEDFSDPPMQTPLVDGIRGATVRGVRLHGVRHPVPAMISWHEVSFTSEDGVLTIRHDHAADAEPISSIVRAANEVVRTERVGLIRGYDELIGLHQRNLITISCYGIDECVDDSANRTWADQTS
jgi:hypothetical protein